MTKLDLIDTTIQPDPFKPQAGDVYEFGHPFTQRLVVEDAPSVGDFRVRFRIDGGDSSLTSVRAFHLLLAGFRGLRGIGRVVEMTAENAAVWARSKRAERAEEHANPDLAPFANLSVAHGAPDAIQGEGDLAGCALAPCWYRVTASPVPRCAADTRSATKTISWRAVGRGPRHSSDSQPTPPCGRPGHIPAADSGGEAMASPIV